MKNWYSPNMHADDCGQELVPFKSWLFMLYDNASTVFSHVAILLSCAQNAKISPHHKSYTCPDIYLLLEYISYISSVFNRRRSVCQM